MIRLFLLLTLAGAAVVLCLAAPPSSWAQMLQAIVNSPAPATSVISSTVWTNQGAVKRTLAGRTVWTNQGALK